MAEIEPIEETKFEKDVKIALEDIKEKVENKIEAQIG